MAITFHLLIAACNSPISSSRTPTSIHELFLIARTNTFSIWATEADRQTAQDILVAIQSSSDQICADLQTACQFPVTVEIYVDQASFDKYVMNPEMRGFFAISGEQDLIQIVSPANPSPHEISYEDGVLVAVHEFTHLALDALNPALPAWLDEGTAVYLAPHKLYTTVCQMAFPFELVPSFRQLTEDYESVQAPDLFAYTAVDYIISEFGLDKLNLLLRTPDDLEHVLGVSQAAFEENWHQFIRAHYHNYSP